MRDARWVLRPGTVDDADQLADLAAATFPLACPSGMDRAAIDAHIRLRLSTDAFRITVAEAGVELTVAIDGPDRVVGYLLLVSAAEEPEVRQVYVRPTHFGTGVADGLMRHALMRAGDRAVWLGTSKQNVRAIAFYRRHGFEIAGERTFWVAGVSNDDWVMRREPRAAPPLEP